MAREIKKSINGVQIVGEISEINLQMEEREVELRGANNTTKKVECRTIGKASFSNPSITVTKKTRDENGEVVKEETFGADFYQTHEKRLDDKGKVIDNPRFKAMETIMNMTKGTRVRVEGSFVDSGYAGEDEWKERKPYVNVSAFNCSSTRANNEESDIADGKISGIVRTIKHETKGEDGEETGRLKVDFYMFDRNGATFPIELTIEKDLADDFEDLYSAGTCCQLDVELVMHHVGSKKTKRVGGFSRRESNMVQGYEVMEVSVFGGDEPLEEANEYFVDIETMKSAIKEREIMKEAKVKERKERDAKKESKASKGLGNRKSNMNITETEDDEDSPF